MRPSSLSGMRAILPRTMRIVKPTSPGCERRLAIGAAEVLLPALQPAVVRAARNAYVIRATSEKSAEQLEAAIREGL